MSRPVHVRHVVDGASTSQGAVAVLGRYMVPQDRAGVNGRQGYQSGTSNRKLREESDFTITFPNDTGGDGIRHLERFLILALRNQAGDYKIGDEWLEVYEGDEPGGDLIAVGTPIEYTITKESIELSCKDALITLTHARETAGGVRWCHAPRDVFDFYTRAWTVVVADDFSVDLSGFNTAGTVTLNATRGACMMTNTAAAGPVTKISANAMPFYFGTGAANPDPYDAWRIECVVDLSALGASPNDIFYLWLAGTDGVLIAATKTGFTLTTSGSGAIDKPWLKTVDLTNVQLAYEGRGRWVYFYVNGELAGVLPMPPNALVGTGAITAEVLGASVGSSTAAVLSIAARRATPYLLRGSDKGDYRLPGSPTPGGLLGSYFSEVATTDWTAVLSPLAEPYLRRLDATVNFAAPGGLPNTWQPAGTPNGEKFSARWTGAIYLDDPSTWLLRVTATDRVRVWVGKTRFGEQIINDWAVGGHAAMTTTTAAATLSALGTAAGWYPIVIEYSEDAGVGGCVLEAQKSGGSWVVPGSTTAGAPALSPIGVFEDHVRAESHYTMLKQIADTFGYQYRCDPMQLESGEFPGRLAPRVRCGRDYDVTVTEDEDTSLQAQGSAADCVDVLMADAQGLADPAGATQLTAEVVGYSQVGAHLLVHEDAEQLADIATEGLLLQRLSSLLALRSSPFEQVSAVVERDGGDRVLVPLPLTGAPAEIAWEPGDGVLRAYPSLGVEDSTYSQMTVVSRAFRPDALSLPGVSYRPRPRSWRAFFERLQRQIVSPQRNYQGQIATKTGSPGSNVAAVAPDNYSRVALPASLDDVVAARLIVLTKSDASAWNLEVNGTVRINGITTADLAGRDIKPWLARAAATEPLMHARLVSAGGGSTGTWAVVIELDVRV